ncbi:MAG: VWA domain-containing protein, partial [Armatimonadetes bacterium]|nr:VWA domain-containing protein [Anaerolineae bacterium]
MTLTTPIALALLLVVLPVIVYLGYPRQRFRRTRDSLSLVLRVVIMTLLVLALAGVNVAQSAQKLAVIFLVDASDSVGALGVEAALNQVRAALRVMGSDDAAGVIVFGGDAQVERAVNQVRDLNVLRAAPDSGNTDISGAVRLALALFPADAARRIVILSDGLETVGSAEAAAELARASGVQISYLPIARNTAQPEVRVADFSAPATVQEGQQFDLAVSIDADVATSAQIVIYAGGEEIFREQTQLAQGMNNRTLTLEGTQSGFRDFQIVVEPPAGTDGYYQNNSLETFSQIVGTSRVLVVSINDEDARYITPALQDAGLQVDSIAPGGLPTAVTGLAQYDSVILVNVPATQLSIRRMQVLQTYVRDIGGGLVVIGGGQSYGPGGYFQTPLEETLPVEMQIKDQQRLPKLTLAYVIDRSGSMGSVAPDGTPMIEIAKEAINRSIDLLQPNDRAAVASFDAVAYWIALFQTVSDKDALKSLVGTLTSSGGTDILAGMRLVAKDIVAEPAEIKHIILLTDGGADPAGLVELTGDLYENNNVTTSTISIGVDSPLLRDMAQAGGGNYHIALDRSSIPTIFAQETVLATRSYIFEESFVPTLTARNPLMDGITALPPLLGYVGVTPKTAAQVILRAPNQFQDPILAAWQYGLGRSVAFMSDATGRWATNWVSWGEFSRFWGQTVRWTVNEASDSTLETQVVMEGTQARVIVDVRDADGGFANGLDLAASVVDPALGSRSVVLRQVAPGRYEAVFTPGSEGAYLISVNGVQTTTPEAESTPLRQTTGWVMRYSQEYVGGGESVLPLLAQITDGQALTANDVGAVFNRDIIPRQANTP